MPKKSVAETDREIRQLDVRHKIVLLGAEDQGRSTIFKQFRTAMGHVWTEQELKYYRATVIANSLEYIYFVLTRPGECTSLLQMRMIAAREDEFTFKRQFTSFPEGSVEDIESLWRDPAIREMYRSSNTLKFNPTTVRFFKDIRRVSSPNYVPTPQDIMRCHRQILTVPEESGLYNDFQYRVVLLPGGRGDRAKWKHSCQEVSCLVFVASLSEYDQNMDDGMNRMLESLQIFDQMVNAVSWFAKSHILLVLNKVDLFKQKIAKHNLADTFPGAPSTKDWKTALEYIKNEYLSRNKTDKPLGHIITNATDMESMKRLFDTIDSTIKVAIGKDIMKKNAEEGHQAKLDLSWLAVPAEVYNFDKMSSLIISHCTLTLLPSVIGRLRKIVHLDLSHNHLSFLPKEIAQLDKLREVNLSHNLFTDLPEALEHMTWIELLNISHCKMTKLNPYLGDWEGLQTFLFDGNPIKNPPPEVLAKPLRQILAFLRDVKKDAVKTYRTKLMFVGQENVGKTSLLKAIRLELGDKTVNKKDIEANVSTDGIDIRPIVLKAKIKRKVGKNKDKIVYSERDIQCSAWDFAGQDVYYSTHSFFLSRRSVFLVLYDATVELSTARVGFWLESIKARAGDSPIILVGTHADHKMCTPKYLEQKKAEVSKHFSKAKFKNIRDYLFVSSIKSKTVKEFLSQLAPIVLDQPTMGEKIPTSYLAVEERIIGQIPQLHPPILTWPEYERLISPENLGFQPELLRNASILLNDLGTLVYVEEPEAGLSDVVVLDPRYLTRVFSSIMTTKRTFVKDGVLKDQDWIQVWKEPEFPVALHPKLIGLLERFDVCFPVPSEKFTLVPALLPEAMPSLDQFDLNQHPYYQRIYTLEYLPFGLFSRLLVRIMIWAQPLLYWRYGVVFRNRGVTTLVQLKGEEKEIHIKLSGGEEGPETLRLLTELLDLFCKSWFSVRTKIDVACPQCHAASPRLAPSFLKLDSIELAALQGRPVIPCERGHDVALASITPEFTMSDLNFSRILQEELVLGEEIGRGAFGVIYRSQWRGSEVAVKVFNTGHSAQSESSMRRSFAEFRREVWVMNGLAHPNVVGLRGFCMEPLAMVMELVSFGDLHEFNQTVDDMDWSLRLRILSDIAQGMLFLHSLDPPLLHKDLKPVNVLLAATQPDAPVVAKVADFGLSVRMLITSFKETTSSSREVTNPTWLAPEVLRGVEYSMAADVYAFSIIMWEVYYRTVPFAELGFAYMWQLEDAIQNGTRPALTKDIPDYYSSLMVKCWDPNPLSRPTYNEVLVELMKMTETLEIPLEKLSSESKLFYDSYKSAPNIKD